MDWASSQRGVSIDRSFVRSFALRARVDFNMADMDALFARLEKVTAAAQEEKESGVEKRKQFKDGRTYYGDLVDGVPHGYGEITRPGGRQEYEGEWENGLYQGKGILAFENGDTWEGMFRRNERHGYGVYTPYQQAPEQGKKKGRPTFRRKSLKALSPEEALAKEKAQQAVKPRNTICFSGRHVCSVDELMDGRVCVKLNKMWRTGTVIEQKERRDGVSFLHRIRWDDAFEEKSQWWDLSAYQFSLLRLEGKHLHIPNLEK